MKVVICVDVDVHILQLPGPHMDQRVQYLHTRPSLGTLLDIKKNSDLLFKVLHQILTILWFRIVCGPTNNGSMGNCGPGFSSIFYNRY